MPKLTLTVQGKGPVTLNDKDYQCEGGEAKIYFLGSTAYKVYHDVTKMVNVAKVYELQQLDHPNIVRPLDVLLDKHNTPIGYTMAVVDHSIQLPRLFVTAFRNQVNITPKCTVDLVENKKETLKFIHDKNFLMVDVNENNFLVDENGYIRPYFIDVCSWQTPSFPPTAIMPSIQDFHTKGFNPNTDWFSFGILAFQLFVGIHPYKGTHPDFGRFDLTGRMKANVSIFDKKTTIPSVTRDFSLIPAEYRDWFEAVFQHGKRLPPPDKAGKIGIIAVQVNAIFESLNFKITLIKQYDQDILEYRYINGKNITILHSKFGQNQTVIDNITHTNGTTDIIITPKMAKPYFIERTATNVKITDPTTGYENQISITNSKITVINNVLYAISTTSLTELAIFENGQKDMLAVEQTWDLLPGQTQLFENMLMANVLGAPYLIIPEKSKTCRFIQVDELKGYRMVNAKFLNKVAIIVGQKNGILDKFIIRFSADFKTKDVRIVNNVDTGDINFTVLPNGVTAHIHEDGQIEIFFNDPTNPKMKIVSDKKISQDMRLTSSGTAIYFHQGRNLQQLSMK